MARALNVTSGGSSPRAEPDEVPRCVRDARPQGRDGAAVRDVDGSVGSLARRWPGAVGHSGIVPYRARSPARSAAEGHAHTLPFHFAAR
jgi:hypothetical protein